MSARVTASATLSACSGSSHTRVMPQPRTSAARRFWLRRSVMLRASLERVEHADLELRRLGLDLLVLAAADGAADAGRLRLRVDLREVLHVVHGDLGEA